MEEQFRLLFGAFVANQPLVAVEKIAHITNYFLEELDSSTKDLYIATIFNPSSGILKFIEDTAKNKNYSTADTRALELVYMLMNNFPVSVSSYLKEIITTCTFVSFVGNAYGKLKALEIFDNIIVSQDIDVRAQHLEDIFAILDKRMEFSTDSVTSKAMTVLGHLLQHHPNTVPDDKKENLLKLYIQKLRSYTEKDTALLIEGATNLIANLLCYTCPDQEDEEVLYGSLKTCCRYNKIRSSQTAYRAALNLFSSHIAMFIKSVYRDANDWENRLYEWLIEGENFKAGSRALDAFHQELSKLLATDDEALKPLLTHFIDKFQTMINCEGIASHRVRIAIRGLGYFASACSVHFSSDYMYNIFISILQKVEHLYIICLPDEVKNLENLPDYVLTLSRYIAELDEIDSFHVASLQKVTILMVRLFPKLSQSHYALAAEALIINMHCIERSKVSLKFFLRDLIEQCVIWTCSHVSVQEVDSLPVDDVEICTFKSFLPLWTGVLALCKNGRFFKLYPSIVHWQKILKIFFDTLMETLIVLVNKLNLDVKSREDCVVSTDPSLTLEAVKINDFVILVNIADFYVAILENADEDLFSKWVLPFSHHTITKSLQHPLVSGFYKLLAADLAICDRLNYFSDLRLKEDDVNLCFQSFVKLILTILPKIRGSKDDLQIACMDVVLSAPVQIIETVDADFTTVFLAVFSVGRTVHHIASKGIDTIERWHKLLPEEKMLPLLKVVLPCLDSYLRTHVIFTQKDSNIGPSSKKNFRKHKVLMETTPQLQKLQQKILRLLSQMNSELCWEFVNANARITVDSWSNGKNLTIRLQNDDIELCLDRMLPRILELAEFCSDKKVRFMACELLHSATMIMIGNSTQREMNADLMLDKIVRVVLILAGDNNMAIRELFTVLITQMMHWYSSLKQRSSPDTQIILTILLNEISKPTDVKTRDVAGKCLKEFVAWTIKQCPAKQLKNNLGNIDIIIDTLKYFSSHPDSSKRLGAALIFNNIYNEFKQEDLLVNNYWLEFLGSFMINLSMTENYNEDQDCLKQVKTALDHLCNGFVERRSMFNTKTNEDVRKTPPKFNGNKLQDVAAFLLQNTTSLNRHSRYKALELFVKLMPLVHGCSEAALISQHEELFFKAYEHLTGTCKVIGDCKGIEEIFKWFHSLNCLLDGHIFAMHRKFLPIDVINNSSFFLLLRYYLDFVVDKNVQDVVKMSHDSEFVAVTTQVREEYSALRRLIIEKIISFTVAALNNKVVLTDVYFNDSLWNLLRKYLLNVHSLGYQSVNYDDWKRKMTELIELLMKALPTNLIEPFITEISTYISNNINKTQSLKKATQQSSRQLLRGIILLQSTSLNEKIDLNTFRTNMISSMFNELIEIRDDVCYVRTLQTVERECCDLKIQFAVENLLEFIQLVLFLCDTRCVKNLETHEQLHYTSYIYNTFESTLVKILTKPECFKIFIDNSVNSLQIRQLQLLLTQILKYISRNLKTYAGKVARNVVNVLSDSWRQFRNLFHYEMPKIVMGINLIEQMAYVDRVKSKEVMDWILQLFEFKADHLTKEEQYNFINQRIFVLGLVIESGQDLRISSVLTSLKSDCKDIFALPSSTPCNSLMIKVLFEAAQYSKSIDILMFALDLFVTTKNDFDSDIITIIKTFMNGMPEKTQLESLHIVHRSCKFDTFSCLERIKLTSNLSCLLECCDYESFENFYLEVIEDMFATISNEEVTEESYISKIITCLLIESLFSRIDTHKFDDKECPITEQVFPDQVKTGRELLQKFTRILAGVCKETAPSCLKELFRLYQCYAYNALVSMVCNTQKERVEPYTLLFHRENSQKEDILWSKLIDQEKRFDFNVQVNEIYARKKVLVKIRTEISQKNAQAPNYLNSQNLFMSTLSEDVCRFDFNNVAVRSQTFQEEAVHTGIAKSLQIELSNEPIDEHECMASICGAIKHMAEINFIPKESAVGPSFINCIRNVLLRESTATNVKLFLGKVVENTAVYLKDHGKWLVGPIIKIIVDGCAGNTINSFVSDLIVMFLTAWSEVEVLAEDKQYISKLLTFLIKNVHHELPEIQKYNLRLLQLAVEKWKDVFCMPYEVVADSWNTPMNEKKSLISVNLVHILVANGLTPWQDSMKSFVINFCNILANESKKVYIPCAETIGLTLKYVSQNELYQSKFENFKTLVIKVLNGTSDTDKFANCLEAMSKHYPKICDNFLIKVMYNVSSKQVSQKSVYLRILIRCADIVCTSENFEKLELQVLLKQPKIEVHVLSLELANKCVDLLTVSQLEPLVEIVSKTLDNKSAVCRAAMYDILMSVYKKYCQSEDDLCQKIVGSCKDVLLQGLAENDLEIEQKITNFWITNELLPPGIDEKILYLLENTYKTSTEDLYLPFSTYVLLGTLQTDINVKLFKKPLADCVFRNLDLPSHWKTQQSSLVPMFASTFYSQDGNFNMLRATQPAQPSSSQNPLATQQASFIEGSSALLIDSTFKNPNEYSISAKFQIYKRRFNKDQDETRKFHAGRMVKAKSKEIEIRKESVKRRESNIQVYRSYRDGDLPDIEIDLASVVRPLQALAKHDAQIARLLFTDLFSSASRKGREFVKKASISINTIFKNSTNYTPTLMAALMDIAIQHKDDVQFEPQIINTVCNNSGLMSLGAILLEEYLILGVDDGSGPSKRIKGINDDSESKHWIKLADLYKSMEDWDVVRAIFLERIKCSELTIEAIEAESNGRWKQAKEKYQAVIMQDVDEERRDFYYESIFKCFTELLGWDELSKHIETVVQPGNVWDNLWSDQWNKQKLLPSFLTSQIRIAIDKPDLTTNLTENINAQLRDSMKCVYLKDNHSDQLAFLSILQKDFIHAKYFLDTCLQNFLENWSYMDPLFPLLRLKNLISLRNIVDMQNFLSDYNLLTREGFMNIINNVTTSWERTAVDKKTPVIQSEIRNVFRQEFSKLMKAKIQDQVRDGPIASMANNALDKGMSTLNMVLIENAINNSNYHVAKKYLVCKRPKLNTNDETMKQIKHNLLYSKYCYLVGTMWTDSPTQYKQMVKALNKIESCMKSDHLRDDPELLLAVTLHLFQLSNNMYRISENDGSINVPSMRLKNRPILSHSDISKYGEESLSEALVHCEQSCKNKPTALLAHMGSCYYKLAHSMIDKGDEYTDGLIRSTFRGMFYGSAEARLLFPSLLNLERLDYYRLQFIEESSKVPVWMFLRWIPQLLSYLDTDKVQSIAHIITQIAVQYPNSLIYPYKMSREKYVIEHSDDGNFVRNICEKLDVLLNNPLIDTLLEALTSVSTPFVIIRTVVDNLKKSCAISEAAFKIMANKVCEELFEQDYDYYSPESTRGQAFKCIDKCKTALQKILKGKYDKKQINSALIQFYKEQEKEKQIYERREKRIHDLGHYSPWLKYFSSYDYDKDVEIPGQYKGDSRPLTQYHIKLSGFASTIKIFDSLRKPIRITMLGSNTKEYMFLVKYGEDLRQDQRIEQMFKLMNNVLYSDPSCCQRKLDIVTYEVIPLTNNLGIIEWVDETETLRKLVRNGCSKAKQIQLENIRDDYDSWIRKVVTPKSITLAQIYGEAAVKFKKQETNAFYRSLVNKVPWDALRTSFVTICVNAENLFAYRERFIRSYAVMCISQWLLGIGDRHLENILISLSDGRVVGIDFGHAFGTATQEQGVPELVPFRLTPQIANITLPHNVQGPLQESMIHALKALRRNKETLLSTLDVFIREPTLNWLNSVDTVNKSSWSPAQRVETARKKFDGANPSSIMMEEIRNRMNDTESVTLKYLEYLKGDEQDNIRARMGDDLSAEEQVKCLVDQATDYNLLGRMFSGWQAWV